MACAAHIQQAAETLAALFGTRAIRNKVLARLHHSFRFDPVRDRYDNEDSRMVAQLAGELRASGRPLHSVIFSHHANNAAQQPKPG